MTYNLTGKDVAQGENVVRKLGRNLTLSRSFWTLYHSDNISEAYKSCKLRCSFGRSEITGGPLAGYRDLTGSNW